MIAKSVAVTVALVLVASASQGQVAPTNIDQAIYVTCRQAHAMNPEARKAGDGKRSTTWARSRPMQLALPTQLSGVG
jgi:hypothetical protein